MASVVMKPSLSMMRKWDLLDSVKRTKMLLSRRGVVFTRVPGERLSNCSIGVFNGISIMMIRMRNENVWGKDLSIFSLRW